MSEEQLDSLARCLLDIIRKEKEEGEQKHDESSFHR